MASLAKLTMKRQAQDGVVMRQDGYAPLREYALVGDCHGAALVCRDGSIDWCCLERFDAEPLFARILDAVTGGRFAIHPEETRSATRRYLPRTAILETTFKAGPAIVTLTDFMTLGPGDEADSSVSADRPKRALVRQISVSEAPARLKLEFQPRRGFSGEVMQIEAAPHGLRLDGRLRLHATLDLDMGDGGAHAVWTQAPGETHAFLLTSDDAGIDRSAALAHALRTETAEFWRRWTGKLQYGGRYADRVARSAIALKLMMYRPTGAMVAAPTSSLPEEIGGVRNWDYRFCWPRDSAFAFYALKKLGEVEDAEAFFEFFHRACCADGPPLPPLFVIGGDGDLDETTIDHFDGYRGSRPVRRGNEAVTQHQSDIYGQLLDLMELYVRIGGMLPDDMKGPACAFADYVAGHWREPDAGLWEPRLPKRRHVHSSIMCWTALDRALRLFGENERWRRERDAILKDLVENAVHEGGYLPQVFGSPDTDAAVLVAPMVGLPIDDAVLVRTVEEVMKQLGVGPLVYRYRNDDGLPGEEGTFLVCAFWLIDALLALGRVEEARDRFEALLDLANDVGLYPEEMGPDGTFLGNFPQAFTHLGLVQSALLLDLYEARGREAIRGTHGDRAVILGERELAHLTRQ
jgi:alpha,alpha-trehalase